MEVSCEQVKIFIFNINNVNVVLFHYLSELPNFFLLELSDHELPKGPFTVSQGTKVFFFSFILRDVIIEVNDDLM